MDETLMIRVNSELIGVFEDIKREVNSNISKIFKDAALIKYTDNFASKLLSKMYYDSKNNKESFIKLKTNIKICKSNGKLGVYTISFE